MKVAMITRATLYSAPGGDTTQVIQTAEALRLADIEVDIHLTNAAVNYSRYDLLHFFNIIRPADILRHLAKSHVPYVVSTIYVEYGHEDEQGSLRSMMKRTFGADGMEYIKAIARRIKNGEQIDSISYLMLGHKRAVRRIASGAAMLLPNSESEYRRFSVQYRLKRPYHIVPNGVHTAHISASYPKIPAYEGSIICMARIEPLKNQLRLIRALRGSGFRLFIHGKPAPNHAAYYQQCLQEAGEDCSIGGWLAGDALYAAYASASVHVLPSFFETTGLSSLEAAAMGCNIVVSPGGDTRDYFGDAAWYCNPIDEDSILSAVKAAHKAPHNTALAEKIKSQYTWARAGEETLKAYREVLQHLEKS